MKIFDTHCDTISKIAELGGNLRENSYHVDLERLQKFDNFAQVFAMFVDVTELPSNITATAFILNLIERYHREIAENSELVAHCNTAAEVSTAFEHGKIAAMLAIEGGEALGGKLENLEKFYNLGVRILTLTWNHANELASGVFGNPASGLTDFGKVAVREMNRLGMIVDVSHLNEAGFWEVVALSQTPVIASHSNARAVCGHPRNLTDKQISALADMGGYVGLNLYADFLNDGENADITDVQRHIEHFEKLGAGGILGLGADFDGVDKLPSGIAGVENLAKIPLSEDISFGNFYKFLAKNVAN